MPQTPQTTRPGIECPRCGSGTYVSRTTNFVSWILRVRTCQNPACRHTFDTSEKIVAPRARPDAREPRLL